MRARIWTGAAVLVIAMTAGCSQGPQTDQQIKQQAAQDARQVKHDAQTLAADAKQEALEAREQAKAVVAGVREGLHDPNGNAGSTDRPRIDINSATADQLETLPGVSPLVARRILRNRPYGSTDELVSRAHLQQGEYDRIADRIVAD